MRIPKLFFALATAGILAFGGVLASAWQPAPIYWTIAPAQSSTPEHCSKSVQAPVPVQATVPVQAPVPVQVAVPIQATVPIQTPVLTLTPATDPVLIAYVTSWSKEIPDVKYLSHINYAFGHVGKDFQSVRIDNPRRLKRIVRLRRCKPSLKVLLSVGGWGSGGFSEMSADGDSRQAFAKSCARLVRRYHLDGIDIDWEYPGSSAAGIGSDTMDMRNYTLLMRDLRVALGKDKLLSQATVSSARYIDFKAVEPYVDYTNIMAYDMGWAPFLNSALYRSPRVNEMCAHEAVEAHLAAGVPADKLVMGLAFYGRGAKGFPRQRDLTKVYKLPGYTYHWDTLACVPYLTDSTKVLVFGYEDLKSLKIKAEYIRKRGLRGAMYWEYRGDNEAGDLRRTVFENLQD